MPRAPRLSGADADRAIGAVLDAITEALVAGDKVSLPGFGIFETRERAARTGRNPQTGEALEIAASTAAAFKPAAEQAQGSPSEARSRTSTNAALPPRWGAASVRPGSHP